MGEFELIDRLLRPLARGLPGALELGDDAALLEVPAGMQLVVAKDALVAGVHFLPDDPPDLVAAKLLRVNLSDLAAMGADPLAYLLALARPPELSDDWFVDFAAGLAREQAAFGLTLVGGDTVGTTGPTVLSATILGLVPRGAALLRSGAAPGDLVCVSGTVGDAAMGLRVLRGLAAPDELGFPLIERYRIPQPRLALGRALRGVASAAIDISDGLLADLGHILERSGVGAVIRAADVPISRAARALPGALQTALGGGDDYELLFTMPPSRASKLGELAAAAGVALTIVGEIRAGDALTVLDAHGRPLTPDRRGWQHF